VRSEGLEMRSLHSGQGNHVHHWHVRYSVLAPASAIVRPASPTSDEEQQP
jgi:hypothetical protein